MDKQYKTIAVLQHQRLLRGANLKIVNGRLCSTTFKILSFKLLFSKIRIPPIFNYNENKQTKGSRYYGVSRSVLAIVVGHLAVTGILSKPRTVPLFLCPTEMKIFKAFITFFILVSAIACKNEKVDMNGYMKERDSLMQENEVRTQQLAELNSVLATIATGLDSIAIQENILFTNKGRDGVMLNRQQIAANLKSMADILARQRTKIKILQDSLANKNSSEGMERLKKVIEFLNLQLAEKDQVIKSLRANLNNSKKDILQLHTTLNDMKTRVSSAENKAQILTTALSQQDEVINECYVKIGTKKQLSAAGLLKGGFLQKKKVNYEGMDKSKFNAVDIRKFREITLKSKNPKILTPQPSTRSFHFEESGDGNCTLVITNPTLFWSVSNFLIIQL